MESPPPENEFKSNTGDGSFVVSVEYPLPPTEEEVGEVGDGLVPRAMQMHSKSVDVETDAQLKKIVSSVFDMEWHLKTVSEALHDSGLGSESMGLSQGSFSRRQSVFGSNALSNAEARSALAILFSHFFNPLTGILAAVFIIAVVNKEWIEAITVVLIILINSLIGAKQEIDSEKAMLAVQKLATNTTARVVRDGRIKEVSVDDLVIGDLVEIRLGEQCPADLRLLSCANLQLDEAVLTGEALPVEKTADAIIPTEDELRDGVTVGDRVNMAFRQTAVVSGFGRGVVVSTGRYSEMGKIAERLSSKSSVPKTPLTLSLERLMYLLVVIGLLFGVFIFWAFEWDVNAVALLYASATLVAILPEAAIVLVTVTQAIGSRRMAERNALVRKMSALEQLGKVTDICSDKTGTLTEGTMTPSRLVVPVVQDRQETLDFFTVGGPPRSRLAEWYHGKTKENAIHLREYLDSNEQQRLSVFKAIRVCSLCASTALEVSSNDGTSLIGGGNPTELALQELVHKASHGIFTSSEEGSSAADPWCGLKPIVESSKVTTADLGFMFNDAWERRGEWTFDSKTKRMTVGWLHRDRGDSLCVVKGAPEKVFSACEDIDQERKRELMNAASEMARDGLRVLALAERTDLDLRHIRLNEIKREEVEQRLRFVGLVALRDPPKPESKSAVLECMSAGIVVRMLTGDHYDTAIAIAKEVGILDSDLTEEQLASVCILGSRLDRLSDRELDEMPHLPLVVARSSPTSKVRLVEALRRRNRISCMTGDGVNDSPAMKEADIGVAMGIKGSDVTKAVSDIVLTDDNFATIVMAVREGRRIYDSILRFLVHLLSGNVAEAILLLVSLAYVVDSDGIPTFLLSPVAILWLNIATGSGPAIGIALDPPAPDIMTRPPIRTGIFTLELITDFLFYGATMGVLTLASATIVLWGFNDPQLGRRCNELSGVNCGLVEEARGTAFLVLNTLLLLHAYNCRHFRESALYLPLFSNKVLTYSVVVGTLTTIPLLYTPYLSTEVFKHGGVSWEWGLSMGMVLIFIVLSELWKFGKRRYFKAHAVGARGVQKHVGEVEMEGIV